MHPNLTRRFTRLATQQSAYRVAMLEFQSRYHLLFAALAEHLNWTQNRLAKAVGFDPCPEGGNAIMRGTAEASVQDCLKLLALYLAKVST